MSRTDRVDTVLSERKKLILKAIIEAYIRDGEPVGSKYLAECEQIKCSSATVRNEMAELEALGYLEQPHLSSGRIPTERGYRFYVDTLMQQYSMTAGEIDQLNRILGVKHAEADTILENATQIMSHMTNYTGLTVRPRPSGTAVSRFDTMYIDEANFALIMLTSSGAIKTKRIRTGFPVSDGDVSRIGEVLNQLLVNLPPESINVPIMVEIERRLPGMEPIVSPLVKVIYDALKQTDGGELKYEGVNKLLEYPEFSDTEKLKHLLAAFDNKSGLLDVVSNAMGDDTNIIIGSENPLDEMNDSSIVFQTIKVGGRAVGAIGIVGPRRMDYARVCAMVKYIAAALEKSMGVDSLMPPADNV